jgi:hypothetical protein
MSNINSKFEILICIKKKFLEDISMRHRILKILFLNYYCY